MPPATTMRRLPEVAELRAVLRAVRTTPTGARLPGRRLVTAGFLAILLGILHTAQSAAWNPSPPRPRPSHEESQMSFPKIPSRGTAAIVAAAAAASSIPFTSTAAAQDAVQWRVEDGGNGHWYQLVVAVEQMSKFDFAQLASANGAHLVTITTAIEQSFIEGIASVDAAWSNYWVGPIIGMTCDGGPCSEGCWDTGESMEFTKWHPGNPDIPDVDNCVMLFERSQINWQNFPCHAPTMFGVPTKSAIIEWSTDCNADGIVDYGQILAGELDDTNGNNIPDCCEADVPCNCPADLDDSGAVNGVDLAIILNTWGTNGGKYPQADIDGDGVVGGTDLALILGAWGDCE